MRTVTQPVSATEATQVIPRVAQPEPEYRGKHALDVVPERFDRVASMSITTRLFDNLRANGAGR